MLPSLYTTIFTSLRFVTLSIPVASYSMMFPKSFQTADSSVPAQFTPAFNQRLFDVKGETIGIAVHGNVNNHTPFLQRCPLAIDLRGFEMELVP